MRRPLRHSRSWCAAWCAACLIAAAACAHIAPPTTAPAIDTDRPDKTDGTTTVLRGFTQAEGGYTYSRADGVNEQAIGEALVRIGLSARSEVRVGLNSYAVTDDGAVRLQGMQDAAFGVKVRLVEDTERFSLWHPGAAVIATTTVPTGAAPWRVRTLQPETHLALFWPLTSRLGLTTNINASFPVEDGRRYTQGAASGSFGYEFSDRLQAFAEWFSLFPASRGGANGHYIDSGVMLAFGENTQLDLRAGISATRGAGDSFIGAGIARRWGRLRP